jgi:hypothetical protein
VCPAVFLYVHLPSALASVEEEEHVDISSADLLTLKLLHSLSGCELCDETDVLSLYNIDNGHNIIKKICTDEVLEEFKDNNLDEHLNIDIFDDLAVPSHL